MEPQTHPRAGTPELASEKEEATVNQNSSSPVRASGTEGSRKSNEQQVIVEHPGARHKMDNKNNEVQEKDANEPENRKVEHTDKARAKEKSTESKVSNKKQSRSCNLI